MGKEDKKKWMDGCKAEAKAAFEAAGGKASDFEEARKRGAESKGSDKMKACVEAAVEADGKDMKTATKEDKKTWMDGCKAEAKAAFEAAGGKASDFETARRRGAESKGSDKMKA